MLEVVEMRGYSLFFLFCKQKTAYEMRISDWSSDVCSSDLPTFRQQREQGEDHRRLAGAAGDQVADADHRHRRLPGPGERAPRHAGELPADRKSVVVGKRVSVRIDLGGRRIITK